MPKDFSKMFATRPLPWRAEVFEPGMEDRHEWEVLATDGEQVADNLHRDVAEFIVAAANQFSPK